MSYKKIVIKDSKGTKYYPVTSVKNIPDIEKISEYINIDNIKIDSSTSEKLGDTITNIKNDLKDHKHSANDITETNSRKFVTDAQLSNINTISDKATKTYVDNKIKEANQFNSINKGNYSFDSLKEPGIYRIYNSNTSPCGTSADYMVAVYKYDYDNNVIQIAHSSASINNVHSNKVYVRSYYNNTWSSWRELTNVQIEKEIENLKLSGVEINKLLVDALNSKDVPASTNDSIKTNAEKVKKIESNYDWKIKNLLHHSNFIDGWSKWSENQNVMLDKTNDNGLKVIFNQTNSTPGLRRKEADIMLSSLPKTLSFLVKQSNPSNHTIAYFFDKNGEKIEEGPRLISYNKEGYTKYVMNFSLPKTDKYQLMILTNSPKSKGDYMIIKDIMIENGREANTYRPFTLREGDYKGSFTKTLTNQGDSINLNEGYYDKSHIRVNILNLKSKNIKAGVNVGGVRGTYDSTNILTGSVYYKKSLHISSKSGFKTTTYSFGRKVSDCIIHSVIDNRFCAIDALSGKYFGNNHYLDSCKLSSDKMSLEIRTYNWPGGYVEIHYS